METIDILHAIEGQMSILEARITQIEAHKLEMVEQLAELVELTEVVGEHLGEQDIMVQNVKLIIFNLQNSLLISETECAQLRAQYHQFGQELEEFRHQHQLEAIEQQQQQVEPDEISQEVEGVAGPSEIINSMNNLDLDEN